MEEEEEALLVEQAMEIVVQVVLGELKELVVVAELRRRQILAQVVAEVEVQEEAKACKAVQAVLAVQVIFS
jgi:protein required for attachment to host cells